MIIIHTLSVLKLSGDWRATKTMLIIHILGVFTLSDDHRATKTMIIHTLSVLKLSGEWKQRRLCWSFTYSVFLDYLMSTEQQRR